MADHEVDGYKIGPFGGFYSNPDGAGWSRAGCWYGNQVGGDEAKTLAFTASYVRDLPNGRTDNIDVSYYVYSNEPDDFGVVEYTEGFERDEDGEVDDSTYKIEDEGLAPAFTDLAAAMRYAKAQAEHDLRWCLRGAV